MRPGRAEQCAVAVEVAQLQGVEHLHGVALHLVKEGKVAARVEEHSTNDFRQDMFGGARHACVVEQVAGAHIGIGEERIGQPARCGRLVDARRGLQELDTVQYAAVLILPSAARGQQLLQHEGARGYFVLVPAEGAEIAQAAEHRGCQNAARAQPRTSGDSREQGDFYAAAEGFQLCAKGGVGLR